MVATTKSIAATQASVLGSTVPGSNPASRATAVLPQQCAQSSKDAGSAALYGARAAYGVILVTTKHGRKGHTQITYNGNYAVATPTTSHQFITDGYEDALLVDQAFRIVTQAPASVACPAP